jgi:hypothetical protein
VARVVGRVCGSVCVAPARWGEGRTQGVRWNAAKNAAARQELAGSEAWLRWWWRRVHLRGEKLGAKAGPQHESGAGAARSGAARGVPAIRGAAPGCARVGAARSSAATQRNIKRRKLADAVQVLRRSHGRVHQSPLRGFSPNLAVKWPTDARVLGGPSPWRGAQHGGRTVT